MKNWIKYILVVLIMALSASALSARSVTIEMKEFGTFKDMIGEQQLKEIDSLTIIGPFDKADFIALQPALTYNAQLKYLNLYKADLKDKAIPGDWMYSINDNFKEIVLPPDLKIIGPRAFICCYLETIELPDGLKEIGDYAFAEARHLKHIKIPQSCQSIGDRVFSDMSALISIEFPDGISTIGKQMCLSCYDLQYVYLPNSITSIGRSAFKVDKQLKAINLPENLEVIGEDAFYGSGIVDLVLPAKLKEIKAGAFEFTISGKLYSKASIPPLCEQKTGKEEAVFSDYNKTLYVPIGCAEAYRNAPVWCNFKDIRETDDFPVAGVKSTEKAEPLHVTAGTGYLIIHAETEQADYAVYDAAGQLKAKGCASADTRIDLPAGIYLVTIGGHTAKARVR